MSWVEIKTTIYTFYKALIKKNIAGVISLCTEDVVLNWAHFTFTGKKKVKQWTEELGQMFPKISIVETKLTVNGNKVMHDFVIQFMDPDDQRGLLPAKAVYNFKENKFQKISINPLRGFLIFSQEETKQ